MSRMPEPPGAARVLAEVQAALQSWSAAHPAATFYDLEVATERELARVRAALLQEVVQTVAVTVAAEAPRPACPTCEAAMQHVGVQARTVLLAYDAPVTIQGARYRCPACEAGLSPPR